MFRRRIKLKVMTAVVLSFNTLINWIVIMAKYYKQLLEVLKMLENAKIYKMQER